jgi:hypothetical protein
MIRKLSDSELRLQLRRAQEAERLAERSEPRAVSARYDRDSGLVELKLANGCFFAFPAAQTEGLAGAPAEQLENVEVLGNGYALRWEELDADLTVPGLLAGHLGSRGWMAGQLGRAGGRATSPAKARAAKRNGRKGGRPRKVSTGK